jgi:hypothetical protein
VKKDGLKVSKRLILLFEKAIILCKVHDNIYKYKDIILLDEYKIDDITHITEGQKDKRQFSSTLTVNQNKIVNSSLNLKSSKLSLSSNISKHLGSKIFHDSPAAAAATLTLTNVNDETKTFQITFKVRKRYIYLIKSIIFIFSIEVF